jgi:peroxiredoxin Q/BCP
MRDSGITRIILTVALVSAVACDLRADNPTTFTVHSAVDDSTFELAQHKGKPVVLHFLLKTECPYCMRYTHDYAALAETTPDVVHVFLKPDTAMEIKAWAGKLSKEGLKDLPVIYRDPDAALATQYQIPDGYKFHGQSVHFPALVALDADGKELFRYVGKSNSDRMKVKEFSKKLDEHLRAKTSK